MNEQMMKETEDDEAVISTAIEHMAFFLFSILSDCYPEIATTEFENIFNEEFKTDVVTFIKNYRNNVIKGLSVPGKDLAQVYANQRFFEKLSRALDKCKKVKPAGSTVHGNNKIINP